MVLVHIITEQYSQALLCTLKELLVSVIIPALHTCLEEFHREPMGEKINGPLFMQKCTTNVRLQQLYRFFLFWM